MLTDADSIKYIANISRRTLKAACKELGRFVEASKKVAVEDKETLHLVIPMLYELKTKMLKQEIQYKEDSPEISQLCRDLAKFVDEKCWAKLTWYHFAAAFLHPVYREHKSLKSNAMEQELDRVRLDMKGMMASLEDKALGSGTPPKKKRRAVLLSDSDDDLDQETDEVTNSAPAADEIDAYSTTNVDFEDGNDAPLAFWKSYRTRFPKLALIARSVYSIPASQNKTERAFSSAGHVMTDLRTTLDPEHLDELLLLRSFNKLKGSIA